MSFRHDIRIRYGEVDMQGVVFNAHYLAYVDHCIDRWLRSLDVLTADGTLVASFGQEALLRIGT